MKFLTFSDIHEDFDQLKKLVARAKEDDIDFVIIAGDFSNFGSGLKPTLKKVNELKKPIYIIPGNHEEDEGYAEAIKDYEYCHDMHKQVLEIEDYVFLFYGGGGFAQKDPEFRALARQWYGKYKEKKIVLVTHMPLYNTKLDIVAKKHVGSIDYRKFAKRIKPKLVISGHIHESAGEIDELESIKLVNPCWEGMVIELS